MPRVATTEAPAVSSRAPKAADNGTDKRACLLAAAVKVFMAQGFHASMDNIAAQAKVAKQTVYNHYGSKEKLFEEVIRHIAGTIVVSLGEPDVSVRTALLRFAKAIRARTLSPEGIGVYRALVAEAPRFPSLARLIYKTGPQAAQDALAQFLERRMASKELRKTDARFAAEMLMSMLTGYDRARLLYGMKISRTNEQQQCERIVDCFLRTMAIAGSKNSDYKGDWRCYAVTLTSS
ncbi:MAG: TetR/AcrR family transcriptional regulator [Betaproteobacteria bacterium]|nr:TetR/AcrR family transcriptional regulator [Betaproteobacteria bacterium]